MCSRHLNCFCKHARDIVKGNGHATAHILAPVFGGHAQQELRDHHQCASFRSHVGLARPPRCPIVSRKVEIQCHTTHYTSKKKCNVNFICFFVNIHFHSCDSYLISLTCCLVNGTCLFLIPFLHSFFFFYLLMAAFGLSTGIILSSKLENGPFLSLLNQDLPFECWVCFVDLAKSPIRGA